MIIHAYLPSYLSILVSLCFLLPLSFSFFIIYLSIFIVYLFLWLMSPQVDIFTIFCNYDWNFLIIYQYIVQTLVLSYIMAKYSICMWRESTWEKIAFWTTTVMGSWFIATAWFLVWMSDFQLSFCVTLHRSFFLFLFFFALFSTSLSNQHLWSVP